MQLMTFMALGRGNYFISINNSFLCCVRRARRLFSPSLEPEVAPNKQPTAGGKSHKLLDGCCFVWCVCVCCVWMGGGQAGGLVLKQQKKLP